MTTNATQQIPDRMDGGATAAQRGSDTGAGDTNDPLWLDHDGRNYAWLPNVPTSYFSTPNAAGFTGDLDVRFHGTPTSSWNTSSDTWASQWNSTGSQKSWISLTPGEARMCTTR